MLPALLLAAPAAFTVGTVIYGVGQAIGTVRSQLLLRRSLGRAQQRHAADLSGSPDTETKMAAAIDAARSGARTPYIPWDVGEQTTLFVTAAEQQRLDKLVAERDEDKLVALLHYLLLQQVVRARSVNMDSSA